MWASLLVTLVSLLPPGDSEGDLARLQGRWRATVGAKSRTTVVLEIKGRTVSATIAPARGLKVRASGELRLDETASPKALDWVKLTTRDGQEVPDLAAIYRLDGDRLVLRSGGFNDPRPTEFKAGPGLWDSVLIFERP
jgi:uncharacterized protein (TIGR03067 family)